MGTFTRNTQLFDGKIHGFSVEIPINQPNEIELYGLDLSDSLERQPLGET